MSQLNAIKSIKIVIFHPVTSIKIYEWSNCRLQIHTGPLAVLFINIYLAKNEGLTHISVHQTLLLEVWLSLCSLIIISMMRPVPNPAKL